MPPATALERGWHDLRDILDQAARVARLHARGWVAEADRLAEAEGAEWPAAGDLLRAAGFVMDNAGGTLNGEVASHWPTGPAGFLQPLVPVADPDPDALPATWRERRAKLSELAAMLDDVCAGIERCDDAQAEEPGYDPADGPLLHTLGGAALALGLAVRELNDVVHRELDAASARRAAVRSAGAGHA